MCPRFLNPSLLKLNEEEAVLSRDLVASQGGEACTMQERRAEDREDQRGFLMKCFSSRRGRINTDKGESERRRRERERVWLPTVAETLGSVLLLSGGFNRKR